MYSNTKYIFRLSYIVTFTRPPQYICLAKNAAFTQATKKLMLFDNEWSLQNAYEYIYGLIDAPKSVQRRLVVLPRLLNLFCIFRKETVEAVEKLSFTNDSFYHIISNTAVKDLIPIEDVYVKFVAEKFQERLNDVTDWIQKCKSMVSF